MTICPHCSGKNLRIMPSLSRDDVTGFLCLDCQIGFIPHPEVKPARKGLTIQPCCSGLSSRAHSKMEPKARPARMRERYGCPFCGEAENLSQNLSLRRVENGKTTTGHTCNVCGMTFIDHPNLKRRTLDPSRLLLSLIEPAITPRREKLKNRASPSPNLDETNRGNGGRWLVRRVT